MIGTTPAVSMNEAPETYETAYSSVEKRFT